MRTTVTFEPDVAAMLERIRKERALGLKEAVNEAMRLGLRELEAPIKPRTPFRTREVDVGGLLIDISNVAEALAIAEGDDYK
jgi:hypothetical protein